jgi:hypothetical protein
MVQRLFFFAMLSLQLLISADESNVSSVIFKKLDVQTSQIYPKLNSKALLQAITKFFPVRYQKGAASSVVGCPYHIGDFAQGGVIIWLTQDGLHGLVAAIQDVSDATGTLWSTESVETKAQYNYPLPLVYAPNTTPAENYSGYQNQKEIINGGYDLTKYPAFEKVHNYSITINGVTYDDWFLPSSSELSLMYAARGVIKTVSEAHGGQGMLEVVNPNKPYSTYWSSRESAGKVDVAWYLVFSSGDQFYNGKEYFYAVRCLRAF